MEEDGSDEIDRLPEGCISNVISLTTPRDSCQSALVSTTFRSATESDTVWERFLPPDYLEILSRAVYLVKFSTKKDLYFRLCDSILIDSGRMTFALEKAGGGKCYTLSARELAIKWGDSPEYWSWISCSESRFSEVAKLLNVWWLEIHGKLDRRLLSPKTTYAANLLFKLIDGSGGLSVIDQEASVKVGEHVFKHPVCLQPGEAEAQQLMLQRFRNWPRLASFQPPQHAEEIKGLARVPCLREDGWMEMLLGEFFNHGGDDGEVEMSFKEVKGMHRKSGLIIEGIELRPKR